MGLMEGGKYLNFDTGIMGSRNPLSGKSRGLKRGLVGLFHQGGLFGTDRYFVLVRKCKCMSREAEWPFQIENMTVNRRTSIKKSRLMTGPTPNLEIFLSVSVYLSFTRH